MFVNKTMICVIDSTEVYMILHSSMSLIQTILSLSFLSIGPMHPIVLPQPPSSSKLQLRRIKHNILKVSHRLTFKVFESLVSPVASNTVQSALVK